MIQAWRIVKEKYAATAFSGEGASRTGGRWNSHGVWMVYASSSCALAALENLVHLNPPMIFSYLAIAVSIPEELVEQLPLSRLPPRWQEKPAPPTTRHLGDDWVRQARSAVLSVPSAIIPGESNFLLNPAHPDFRKIQISQPEPFSFDPRLLR
jgi:RES domain-containing protein